MATGQRIALIGAGNVAWHLGPALENAGHIITDIYSRNSKNAKALAERLYQTEIRHSLDFSDSNAVLFVLCVSDDAITEVAQEIALPEGAIIVHTSGSKSIGELGYSATDNIGVFYPLQTFSKGKNVKFSDIPIFIEAENKATEKYLLKLASDITKTVELVDSQKRRAIHLSAVFACNFTNHCLMIASKIMQSGKLDFSLLHPLIIETINKSLTVGPEKAQTGPAKRHDFRTLDNHLAFLENDEELVEVYRIISQHIVDCHPLD